MELPSQRNTLTAHLGRESLPSAALKESIQRLFKDVSPTGFQPQIFSPRYRNGCDLLQHFEYYLW